LVVVFIGSIIFFSIFFAIRNGKKMAQSKILEQNFFEVQKAISNFYSDQDRFPSVFEFSKKSLMLEYLSGFPSMEFVSDLCKETWVYKTSQGRNFDLSVCAPISYGNLKAGWNKARQNK
jgi:hypothetical protein